MRRLLILLLPVCSSVSLAACSTAPTAADPASDAPEARSAPATPFKDAVSYPQALRDWQSAEDLNAWIGARFKYDQPRAMRLSETQRSRSGGALPIVEPQAFFALPSGVCVDLSRFAVETLRQIDPTVSPRYLMIEFAPVSLNGNTLRLHWLASFKRDGQLYYFADSKRPGLIAGPYANAQAFIDDYAVYRGRQIIKYRELDSYQRQQRVWAVKTLRAEAP